jgi:hypothetical protein
MNESLFLVVKLNCWSIDTTLHISFKIANNIRILSHFNNVIYSISLLGCVKRVALATKEIPLQSKKYMQKAGTIYPFPKK